MNLSEEAPKLPKLPFLAGDALLVITAVVIALRCETPLTPGALLAITGCIVVGAVMAIIPFLADYARTQDAELTERQNQIAALARTSAESGEQLSIAAASLHGIADSSAQSLKLAELLPQKIQERLADLDRQLIDSADAAQKSVAASQKSFRDDTARLEAAAEKITRSFAALNQTEAAAKTPSISVEDLDQKLAAAVVRATTQLESLIADASTRVVTASQKSVAENAVRLDATAEKITQALATLNQVETAVATKAAALDAIEYQLNAASLRVTTQLETLLATIQRISEVPVPAPVPAVAPAKPVAELEAVATTMVAEPASVAAAAPELPVKEKPAKKARASQERALQPIETPAPVAPAAAIEIADATPTATEPVVADSPTLASVEPIAPVVADAPAPEPEPTPVSEPVRAPAPAAFVAATPAASEVPVAETPKPRARKPKSEVSSDLEFNLGLAMDSASEIVTPETSISSDGATRLIATSYIGIGNKLFIRGEGPGLSWERGVPLQFVSIGKWRWETTDASVVVSAKLYKNDQIECASLGLLTIEPGHQQEVTAGF